ncbi:MAG: PilN domain-containing protein [Planctomycetota bacterium]
MIRINLLPEGMRRAERASMKVFAATMLAVLVSCCTLGWFGYMYFGELEEAERERTRIAEQLASLKDRVAYHDALVKEQKDFEHRKQTIQEIGKSRVLWTKILDELVDVVNNDGDIDRHRTWFRSLQIRDGKGAKDGPALSMPGWVQGDSVSRVADFHDDVQRAPFYNNVKKKSVPNSKKQEDPTRKPAESLYFNLDLEFVAPEQWTVVGRK